MFHKMLRLIHAKYKSMRVSVHHAFAATRTFRRRVGALKLPLYALS